MCLEEIHTGTRRDKDASANHFQMVQEIEAAGRDGGRQRGMEGDGENEFSQLERTWGRTQGSLS